MLTKKEIYEKAFKELEKRRLESKEFQKYNIKKISTECPEIEQLRIKIKMNSIKLIRTTLNQQEKIENKLAILEKIKNENIAIQNKIKILLKKHNFKEDLFNLKPKCQNCNDYGHKNYKYCQCFKTIVKKIAISEFQKSFHVKLTKFESFSLEFYSKEENCSDNGISDYNKMNAILKICKKFAKNFPKVSSYGLIMHGKTGLGKTHLSMAIASYLISKNFTIIYATAPELIRKISDYQFNKNQNNETNILNLAFKSDLLIIDDLGTEFDSKINQTTIFEILDKRMIFQKPIILNTNLSFDEITKRYDTRILSRITANLTRLNFVGTDIRLQKHKLN